MTPDQALDVLRVMPEPCFVVSGRGDLLGANAAAVALLGRESTSMADVAFASLTRDPPERVAAYIGACARSRSMMLGALTFANAEGQSIRCRCQGAVLQPASATEHALVVIRCTPSERATRDFALLNRQIARLSREVRVRQQVEAERAELLAQARDGQRRLAAQTEALERSYARMTRLQAVTAELSRALTPVEVANAVVEQATAFLDAQAGAVYLLSADRTQLRLEHAVGYPPGALDPLTHIALDARYPVAEAVRTTMPVFIESEAEWRERFDVFAPHPLPQSGLSWATLPLAIDGRVLGALGLRFARPGSFSVEARVFMLALAQQCAQALERARLYVEAQAANRAKSRFLAVMSHELRTPLNAIAGYAELLEMEVHGPVTAAQREALGRLRRSQRRLLTLVDDVLNLARIESGTVEYEVRTHVLDDVLSPLEAFIAPQAAQRGVRYVYRRVDRAVEVRADADRMQQIVLNLLANAVKFTEPGGLVTLEGEAREADVAIRVADTGCGIPAGKLGAIFEPFVQVDAELTRRSEGTGLGLAISRDLARALGGDLVVESVLGKGTTFTLTLPHAQGASAPAHSEGSIAIDERSTSPTAGA
ncbi:MAG TPA: GAF domain-containing sensor histidine kinase [Gemmatimonadaceae bacterium]